MLQGYADDLSRPVRHAEDEDAATAVGESRQLVGERVGVGACHLAAGKAHFLELEKGALAEADLL